MAVSMTEIVLRVLTHAKPYLKNTFLFLPKYSDYLIELLAVSRMIAPQD
jgi:hypothetical protein